MRAFFLFTLFFALLQAGNARAFSAADDGFYTDYLGKCIVDGYVDVAQETARLSVEFFEPVVTDDGGATSAPASVRIIVTAPADTSDTCRIYTAAAT